MEVLKIRHILDKVLNYLYYSDYLNLLIVLNLEKEYAHRALYIKNLDNITLKDLLYRNLKYFNSQIIRSNFTTFWDNIYLDKFNEKFFIDNADLIDHQKLKQLKKETISFDYGNKYIDIYSYIVTRNFTEKFHQTFPLFKNLKICREYSCLVDIEIIGQLCPSCYKNQCPRCRQVEFNLELDERGCCQGCAGCSQYDY